MVARRVRTLMDTLVQPPGTINGIFETRMREIVASDLPSSREVLAHERNALLVPPGDAPALAAALQRLLGDAALRERLARQAWEDSERYSWDARARALLELFEALP